MKSDTLTLISTIVSAGSTFFYTLLTWWLIWESRKMRKLQETPQVDIFIQPAEDWWNKIHLIIRNNGNSGARNIRLNIDEDISMFGKDKERTVWNTGYFKNGISFLAPQTQRETLFTYMTESYQEKINRKIKISATYETVHGETISSDFIIDLSEFENTLLATEPPAWQIAKSIKKIEGDIAHIASGWSKIQVITQTKKEKREEEEENYRQHREATEKPE